ncbi:MAG TPA: methionine synthase [Planctomycetota bacterium]|nr:methionine synthase [Planctomycetota bacterium]
MTERGHRLAELFKEKILCLDGAMGTMIQRRKLSAADFGGAALDGCNENLVLTRPDVISAIHDAYFAAGADIVETNTFGATSIVLAEYGLAAKSVEINRAAARLARASAAKAGSDRFVAGSMGPTTRAITVTGGVTFDQLIDAYRLQAVGLIDGGADLLLLETAQDTRNVKAGLLGIRRAFAETGIEVPVSVSATIEATGTMLAGQGVEALWAALEHGGLLSIGLNCATGPRFMADHLRTLAALAPVPVTCYPNAGLPNTDGQYDETPAMMAAELARFVEHGWINAVGGCCGTTPEYIREFAKLARSGRPRVPATRRRTHFSGIDYAAVAEDSRPVIVGERTNVLGSRKFKKLIAAGEYEQAAEIGRKQVLSGAHILDVCLQDPDRDETADMVKFLEKLIRRVKAPLMLDSTDAKVLEVALTWCQGKSIINSINLEDGEDRFQKVVPLAKAYGSALVVGCIDEKGQGVSTERKVAIAERSYALLTEKYGVSPEDILWDPLVFPCASGDKNYIGSAKHTIDAIHELKRRWPRTRTILGISNVSFGVPAAGREILNAVYLYHASRAGLDLAIVSSEKLVRYASIPEGERKLCDDLLFNRGEDPIAAFTDHFRGKKIDTGPAKEKLPLDERLARYIVDGSKDGLVADLDVKLKEAAPLDIINGPLMKGMDEVGRLFNANELIVAEVLQSAEAMKAAVSHLERFMERDASSTRGTALLATVKGDVHDIGKNLVEIILANNGYRVVNLGIKVAPETLIEEFWKHKPDFIGLSGLLVKSAQQMVATAEDFRDAGLDVPVVVGGAALTKKFAYTRIRPAYGSTVVYARDAMSGLDIANQLVDPDRRRRLEASVEGEASKLGASAPAATAAVVAAETVRSTKISADEPIRRPPDLRRHVVEVPDLASLWPYLNLQMLYSKHLGLKGSVERLAAQADAKLKEVEGIVRDVQRRAIEDGWLKARGVYQFFPVSSEGNDLVIYDEFGLGEVERFTFPRQPGPDGLCLADFARPEGPERDYVAMFVTSCGEGVRPRASDLKERGEYVLSHTLQSLAIETAEAFAEKLHRDLREAWGIADPPSMTMAERLKARYQGIRVSFGYPACPDLADQEKLWRLLKPDEIGVKLTEGHMMDPEASVSALVFHHSQARYFNVGVPALSE